MPRVFLIHGFNVRDKGNATVDRLAPFFTARGHEVIHDKADYGWVWLFRLRQRNEKIVRDLLNEIRPGDWVVAHSNGCLITHMLVAAGAKLGGIILIQPALRKDTVWPAHLPLLCLYNNQDHVVRYGARAWSRFVSTAKPWADIHGWGAAGFHGFKKVVAPHQQQWQTNEGPYPAAGHSTVFQDMDALLYWGVRVVRYYESQLERIAAASPEPVPA